MDDPETPASPDGAGAARSAGRPRSSLVTETILRTALALAQSDGCEDLTVEKVAEQAGVAKTTLYRRWPNVWAIVLDAFLADVLAVNEAWMTGTARESFTTALKNHVRIFDERRGPLLARIIARGHLDENLMEAVQARWIQPIRKAARSVVRQGIASGELIDGLDPDLFLDMLFGPLYHRLLVTNNRETLTSAHIDALIDSVFRGVERRPAPP
ncbi:MAG TPA: TetR/AcrR family transcriptional regulator [Candidatus Elarobacter sp.]|nr:TetR/AcrR family transcriptional regulator [Candidatus Elarobacter sp.]